MSKIIENFLIPLFVIMSVLYVFHSFGLDSNTITLNKAYHHMAPEQGYLERANISLYFSGEPQIQEVKNKKMHDNGSCTFLFSNATIGQSEAQAMVDRINNYQGNYKVSIMQVTKPVKGMIVQFNYDPQVCMINYEQFDSIGLQKGFVFRIYNKELLHKLEQANNQPILRTLHNNGVKTEKRPSIVIDPGHGGQDTGAIGCNGIQEKQVCLAISTDVGNLLKQQGYSVLLTRNNDCDRALDERTSYTNNHNADLFVSIHANYAANPKVIGVETFCMQQNLFKKKYCQLSSAQDCCVTDVMAQRAYISHKLAQSVQQSVCNSVAAFHDTPIDRKVKYSVSQVLLGVQIPAILVEVGFLSHPKESQLLQDQQYQNCIAHGICNGILSFASDYFL